MSSPTAPVVSLERRPAPVPVGGLTPLTTVDWPGMLSAVLFLRGCPWRCGYCHNADLQGGVGPTRAWPEVRGFLMARRGLLDAVVFSGGEPTLYAGLEQALREVRAMGFATGLHTGGPYPARLAALLDAGLLDWVGFDVKAPRCDYDAVTGVLGSGDAAWRSLRGLVSSGVSCELRTTVTRAHHDRERLLALARDVAFCGAGNLVLQPRRLQGRPEPGVLDLMDESVGLMRDILGTVGVRAS
ncbi:MAG: anaerobic ribonucleoside-triphosphate reductase activating protein [Pseudomonadota bacterium]